MNDDTSALLGAYAIDAVDERERALVEAYLRDHPEAQTEVDELRAAASRLALLSDDSPPPALRGSVLDAISRVRPLPPPADNDAPDDIAPGPSTVTGTVTGTGTGTGTDDLSARRADRRQDQRAAEQRADHRGRPSRRTLLAGGLAAGVAVLGGAGLAITRPWDGGRSGTGNGSVEAQIRGARDTRTFDLKMGGHTMQVMRSPSLGRTMVHAASMPAAPSGRVYQVWWQHQDGSMTSAGLLPAGGGSEVDALLSNDGGEAVGTGITLEPAGGSPAPTGSPLALLRF